MATPAERLAALGITLPAAPPPAAAYLPWIRTGNLIFTAGQIPVVGGQLVASGKLGDQIDVTTGQDCARRCAINVIAQLQAALGDLGRVRQICKVTVFVSSVAEFTEQHLVANAASELFADVFGAAGRHARSAVGAPCLPLDAPVEVEAIVEVE